MKQTFFLVLLLGLLGSGVKGQPLDPETSALQGILNSPSYQERHQQMDRFFKDHQISDEKLRAAVRERLLESFNASCSIEDREVITELAARMGDPQVIPIFIQHLTATGPPHISFGISMSGFRSAYPYASALTYFGTEAVSPLLDAVEKSQDPLYNRIAEKTLGFMDNDVIYSLIERCKTSDPNSKLTQFIAKCLIIRASVPNLDNFYIKYVMDNEKDPLKQQRLISLKALLGSIEGYVPSP